MAKHFQENKLLKCPEINCRRFGKMQLKLRGFWEHILSHWNEEGLSMETINRHQSQAQIHLLNRYFHSSDCDLSGN